MERHTDRRLHTEKHLQTLENPTNKQKHKEQSPGDGEPQSEKRSEEHTLNSSHESVSRMPSSA